MIRRLLPVALAVVVATAIVIGGAGRDRGSRSPAARAHAVAKELTGLGSPCS